MVKPKDLTGEPFGRLTVMKLDTEKGADWWICQCSCGVQKSLRSSQLKIGRTMSCGCLLKESSSKRFWKGHGDLSGSYWCHLKIAAKNRKLDFSITIEEAWEKYLEQNKICALSGVELEIVKGYSKDRKNRDTRTTASLDRIDSSKGYITGNIQWIHKDLQKVKWNLTDDRFIEVCKLAKMVLDKRNS